MSLQSTESVVSSFFLFFFYLLSYTVTFSILSRFFSDFFAFLSNSVFFFCFITSCSLFLCAFPLDRLYSVPLIFFYSYLLACLQDEGVQFLCFTEFSSFMSAYFVTLVLPCSYAAFLPISHCFSILQILRLPFNQQVFFHASFPFKTSFLFSATLKCNMLPAFILKVITHVTRCINNQ